MTCVVFDSHHPKHYLTLRQLGRRCRERGVQVVWTARDKDVLVDLIRDDGEEPMVLTAARKGPLGLLGELVTYDFRLARLVRRLGPAALMGNSIAIAHVGGLLGVPSLLINDDDAAANPQYPKLGYPFASRIITPECLGEDHGARHRTYPGLHELAYLHPAEFAPDPGIRRELGVDPGTRIFLVRSVALQASHDLGARGLAPPLLHEIIDRLSARGRVFVSCERPAGGEAARLRLPCPPSRMHHVLAACDLQIGDSQTMAAEAAVLGVPSIRINTFVGRISYLQELEGRFGLTFGFRPRQRDEILARLEELLGRSDLRAEWRRRRAAMLAAWIDPTDVFWRELSPFLGG